MYFNSRYWAFKVYLRYELDTPWSADSTEAESNDELMTLLMRNRCLYNSDRINIFNVNIRSSLLPRLSPKLHKHIQRDILIINKNFNMNDAELYTNNHALQRRDTKECLKDFGMKISWKNYGAKIIDIGCGDGSTTIDILKPFIPKTFDVIIGGDVSEKMVNFANSKYGSEQVMFMRLNIESRLPEELEGRFDHAFSFFTLHWIKQQKLAFTNIYNLLAEGGNCLVMFLSHMPVFDVYRVLARNAKWSAYLKDVDKFTSPYHDSQHPDEELKSLMLKIGFRNVEVRNQMKCFAFKSLDSFDKALKAVNPFSIPEEQWQDYLTDYVQVLRDMNMLDETEQQFLAIFNYKVLIAVASK